MNTTSHIILEQFQKSINFKNNTIFPILSVCRQNRCNRAMKSWYLISYCVYFFKQRTFDKILNKTILIFCFSVCRRHLLGYLDLVCKQSNTHRVNIQIFRWIKLFSKFLASSRHWILLNIIAISLTHYDDSTNWVDSSGSVISYNSCQGRFEVVSTFSKCWHNCSFYS